MTAKAQRAFSGGIIAPGMYSRSDIPKFDSGMKDGVNIVLRAQGGVINRAGTEIAGGFDNATEDGYPYLIPFEFSSDDSYQLEFADNVMRVIKRGEYVLTGPERPVLSLPSIDPAEIEFSVAADRDAVPVGSLLFLSDSAGSNPLDATILKVAEHKGLKRAVYHIVNDEAVDGTDSTWTSGLTGAAFVQQVFELPTPYAIEDLPRLYAVQDVDTLFIACPGYDVQVLQRGGADDEWTIEDIGLTPSIPPPAGLAGETIVNEPPADPSTSVDYSYVIVAQEVTTSPAAVTDLAVTNRLTAPVNFTEDAVVGLSWVADTALFPAATRFVVGRRIAGAAGDDFDIIGELDMDRRKFTDDGSAGASGVVDLSSPPTQPVSFELRAQVRQTDLQQYVVTSLIGGEESLPSVAVYLENDLTLEGNENRVTWDEVTNADFYNVYKSFNGVYGFIGVTTNLSFDDDNITPDTADNPPAGRNPFSGPGNQPAVAAFVESRLTFASTLTNPQLVEMSGSASPFNFNRSFTPAGSDAVSFRMRSQQLNTVEHVVFLDRPVILTAGAEWVMETQEDAPIEPANFALRPRTYRGSSSVKPSIIGETLVHVLRDGNTIREFSLREDRAQASADLTLLARHLFRGKTIVSMAYAQAPDSVLWVVFADGGCLSMTYLEEHEVWGWTRHEFGGPDAKVKQVSVVREGAYDTPYFVVHRTTATSGGVTTVERLNNREFTSSSDAYFVDTGLQFTGVGIQRVTGFLHMRGEQVAILADGNTYDGGVVDAYGRVDIPILASDVSVGYAYTSRITTLPVDFGDGIQNKGSAIGDYRAASEIALQVVDTYGIRAGREGGPLDEIKRLGYGDPDPLVDREDFIVNGGFEDGLNGWSTFASTDWIEIDGKARLYSTSGNFGDSALFSNVFDRVNNKTYSFDVVEFTSTVGGVSEVAFVAQDSTNENPQTTIRTITGTGTFTGILPAGFDRILFVIFNGEPASIEIDNVAVRRGEPLPLSTGTAVVGIGGDWERDASLVIEQARALPMEITSLVPEWALAD